MKQKTLNATVSYPKIMELRLTGNIVLMNGEDIICPIDPDSRPFFEELIKAYRSHDDLLEALIQVMAGLDEGQVDPETKDLAEIAIKNATNNT